MKYALDSEVAAGLAALAAQSGPSSPTARGDWKALRDGENARQASWPSQPIDPNVAIKAFSTTSKDGATIELRWYFKKDASSGSAIVYAHGGGMILGDLNMYDSVVAQYVLETSVPFLSVGYRLAPEAKGSALAEDVFAGLHWLYEHAAELGVNRERIAIMGDSAGGGIAAGAAILARDRGVGLAKQILIYPMLDDRNLKPINELQPFLTWTYDNNYTGWSALLGDDLGKENVSPIAAPARLQNFEGLASAYIEVGELDIFRDESISYAENFMKAAIPVELRVHPGANHGFERFAPTSKLAQRAMSDRMRIIRTI